MENPWKTLSTELIYDNPWITVEEDQVINPKGGKGIYGRVTFKHLAIAVVPITYQGWPEIEPYIYLVRQFRYTLGYYSWEIPMGGGAKTEEPLEAAKRELKEETGLTAGSYEQIALIHTSNSITNETAIIYLATKLEQGEMEPEDTEDITVEKVPFSKAFEMVENGQITDSISVVSIYKTALLLKSGS